MYSETQRAREMLGADFKGVIEDAEELLRITAGEAGDKAGEVRERIRQRLQLAKAEFNRLEAAAARRIRDTASATDGYVHAHPWSTAGIAAGAALLIGMLISRR